MLDRLQLLAAPVLARLDSVGVTPPIDLIALGDCVSRVLVTMVLSPPADDVEVHLRSMLGPLLTTSPQR